MKSQKSLLIPSLTLGLLLGSGISAQAKEWEQSFVVDLNAKNTSSMTWGFSRDSLVAESSRNYSSWTVYAGCVCGFGFGACSYEIVSYNFYGFDQNLYDVVLKDGLKSGTPLDLTDTNVFKEMTNRDGEAMYDSYHYSLKENVENDTNYFVYKKDSTYYALCQYITVYDKASRTNEGVPGYFAHQCIFQDDGTPTFSKIPTFSAPLPESRLIEPYSIVASPVRKMLAPGSVNKQYLINGQPAKRNSASGIRVEKGRTYRK